MLIKREWIHCVCFHKFKVANDFVLVIYFMPLINHRSFECFARKMSINIRLETTEKLFAKLIAYKISVTHNLLDVDTTVS